MAEATYDSKLDAVPLKDQLKKISNFFALIMFTAVEATIAIQIIMILISFLRRSFQTLFQG